VLNPAVCCEILDAVVTNHNVDDNELFADLLESIDEPIAQVSADGIYDTLDTHERKR
jgi:hypothetical protein